MAQTPLEILAIMDLYISEQQKEVHERIYIDMDQTTDLMELLSNMSSANKSGLFNFSDATALSLFNAYLKSMFTLHEPTTIALICLYIPIFLASLAGNSLAVFVVIRNPHMRRVKNIFLMNLAITDLAVTITCIPMVVGQIVFRLWVYGSFMCKFTGYIQGVSVTCGIFTLCALSIDRYLSIKTPLGLHRIHGKAQAARMLMAIWLLAAIFIAPILYARQIYVMKFPHFGISISYCIEKWPKSLDRKAYAVFLLIATYIIPIIIISICYTLIGKALCTGEFQRKTSDSSSTVMLGRKRVARMLVALIGVFVLSWLPYNILSMDIDLNFHYAAVRILPFTLWLGHAHSAVNPVLYWFLNPSFRHCMRKALRCSKRRNSKRDTASPHFADLGEILRHELLEKPIAKSPVDMPLEEPRVAPCKLKVQSRSIESHLSAAGTANDEIDQPERRVVNLEISPKTSTSLLATSTSPMLGGTLQSASESSTARVVSVLLHYDSDNSPSHAYLDPIELQSRNKDTHVDNGSN